MQALVDAPQLYIRQQKEWSEILIDWESANRYEIMDADRRRIGLIEERGGGFGRMIQRLLLRSHRPMEVDVFDAAGRSVLHLSRAFFFFLSDLFVSEAGRRLGSVHRRFGLLHKKYDLMDETGDVFARVSAPLWRIWTFPLLNRSGTRVGDISKKWSGLLREAFTDADTFLVNFGDEGWSPSQRAVILAAAVSIDFDFFEENQR